MFKYDRNLVSGSEIRVLRIKPAERFRDHLDSTIEYLCLDYNPEFEALSYTWGSPFDDEAPHRKKHDLLRDFEHLGPRSYPLYINGDLFWIGESLDSALRDIRGHVQYEANDLLIWVDAVCIHQSHEAEKNWQVKQMRRAYSQASTVIIWLGPSAENSDTAMDPLQSMMRCNYRDMLADRGMTQMQGTLTMKEQNDALILAGFGKMFGKVTPSDEDIPDFPIEAVSALLARAWWGRIWVLQELAIAKRVTIVCGRKVAKWNGDITIGTYLNTWDKYVKEYGRQVRMVNHRPWTMLNTRLYLLEMKRLMNKFHGRDEVAPYAIFLYPRKRKESCSLN